MLRLLQWVFLVPTVCGTVYAVLCMLTMIWLHFRPRRQSKHAFAHWPPVTILKPVHGLEKNLREGLHSACRQDYPDYQVVLSAQRTNDPAIPLLFEIQKEFGAERITVAIENFQAGTNGKINNLIGALKHARHDILVISDSDVRLEPDYLKTIVAPLADPEVGFACTLYKATCAETWFEKMELLTLNADLMPNIVFAHVTGAVKFCLGASTALRRSMLEAIGGLEALADYLVEDYEMGRRIWESGKKDIIIPYFIETVLDLKTPRQWWKHQVYWDQNSRAARPVAYFFAVVLRAIPFALLFAAARLFDAAGLLTLAAATAVKLMTSAVIVGWGLHDREGLRGLAMLPLRECTALVSWFLSYAQRTTEWRDASFILTSDGRLVSRREQA